MTHTLRNSESAFVQVGGHREGRPMPYALISGKDLNYEMVLPKVVIGRSSSKGVVDLDMGQSSFVSRNHLEIFYEKGKLYLLCHGKNGIFINNIFKSHDDQPYELPPQ